MCGLDQLGKRSISRGPPPEVDLADMLRNELGVEVNHQALRLFVRYHWPRVSILAHAIHDGYEKAMTAHDARALTAGNQPGAA